MKRARSLELSALGLVLGACSVSHADLDCGARSCDAPRYRDTPLPDVPPRAPDGGVPAPAVLAAGSGAVISVHRAEGSRDLLVVTAERVYRVFVDEPARPPAELAVSGVLAAAATPTRLALAHEGWITFWTHDLVPAPEWARADTGRACQALVAGQTRLLCDDGAGLYDVHLLATGAESGVWGDLSCMFFRARTVPLPGGRLAIRADPVTSACLFDADSDSEGTFLDFGSSGTPELPFTPVGDPVHALADAEGRVYDLTACLDLPSFCTLLPSRRLAGTGALSGERLVAVEATRTDPLVVVAAGSGDNRCRPRACRARALTPDGDVLLAETHFVLGDGVLWPQAFAEDGASVLIVTVTTIDPPAWTVRRVGLESL